MSEQMISGNLDDDEISVIAERLLGTCDSIATALEQLGWDGDPGDIEDRLVDCNVEACPGCGWWFESAELLDDDSEPVGCDDCR